MWKALGVLVAVGLLVYGCGASDPRLVAPGDAGAAGGPDSKGGQSSRGDGSPSEGGNPTSQGGQRTAPGDAGASPTAPSSAGAGASNSSSGAASNGGDAGEAGSGAGGAAAEPLPDALIVNQPYTCDDTGPFGGVEFGSYFYLEDWEDGALSTPGVTANSSTLASFGTAYVDSVDCDDDLIDDLCTGCEALWASGSVDVTFDASLLGELPTHVGLIWTDGGFGASVTVAGYDEADAVIYTQTVDGIGDNSNTGTTAEDRFFGIVHYAGVKKVTLVNTSGGIEIDHLQYGR